MEFVLRCVGFVVVVGLNAGARIVNLACPFNSRRCTDFGGLYYFCWYCPRSLWWFDCTCSPYSIAPNIHTLGMMRWCLILTFGMFCLVVDNKLINSNPSVIQVGRWRAHGLLCSQHGFKNWCGCQLQENGVYKYLPHFETLDRGARRIFIQQNPLELHIWSCVRPGRCGVRAE